MALIQYTVQVFFMSQSEKARFLDLIKCSKRDTPGCHNPLWISLRDEVEKSEQNAIVRVLGATFSLPER